jgi:tetratricopeptide (TPR) repeat protein
MMSRLAVALMLLVSARSVSAARSVTDENLKNAAALVFAGRGDEARLQIHKAIDDYRSESNAAGEGTGLFLLGAADVAAGRDAEATTNLESAAVKLEQSGDTISAVIALWALAQYQLGMERVDASMATHERALKMLREAAAPKAKFNLDGLRFLAPAVGLNVGGLGQLFESPQIMKPILLNMIETVIRDSYASLLIDIGKLPEAETQLVRAAAIAPMFGGMFDASIEGHYGDLRRRQWHFDEAREHYRSALESVTPMQSLPGRDDWLHVSIFGKLADIETLEGCTDEALAWNDQALATVRASNNLASEAAVLQNRANLLVRSSRFVEAESVFEDTVALAEILHDRAREASILSDLGWLHVWRGEYGTAVRTFERSIELFQNEHHLEEEAVAWMSLAETYLFLDSPNAAQQAEENAGALFEQSNFRLGKQMLPVLAAMRKWDGKATPDELLAAYAKWWQLPESSDVASDILPQVIKGIFDIHSDHIAEIDTTKLSASPVPGMAALAQLINGKRLFLFGDTKAARAVWLKGLDANPNKDLRAGFLVLIGMTYWKDDQPKEAVRYYQLAAQATGVVLQDIKSEELLSAYLGGAHRWIFDVTIEALLQQRRDEDAFDHTESARARAFLQSIGNTRLQPMHGATAGLVREAEALRRSIADWERQSAVAPNGTAASELRHARERYQVLLERLESANPEYASLTAVKPMRVDDVRRALPAATTLVSYYVIGGHAHAWIIDQARLEHVALKTDQARLDRVSCWAPL